jgi:beta-phosphoglucomutase
MILKGILCDFDGVLSNSGDDTYKSWQFALAKFGLTMSQEEFFLEEGRSSEEILKNFLQKHPEQAHQEGEILRIKNEHYKAHGQYSFYPGALELLMWAKTNNLKFSIVSGGSRERLTNPKNKPITRLADLIISASDVSARKPDPEPYLKAAGILGLAPSEAVVVENAPLGITAAKNANIRCLAVASTLPAKYLSEADKVVDNLRVALRELETWHNKQ